jgi:opacity protein-like surface antigen
MKKYFICAALLATGITNAALPIDGWYGSLFGGYAYMPNNVNKVHHNLLFSHADYKNGYDAGASFGYKCSPMRYEGELTYINSNLDHFKVNRINQTTVHGYNRVGLAMANVYLDLPALIPTIDPFIGIGIGYALEDGLLKSHGPLNRTRFSTTDTMFAYQATGGLTYNFDEAWAFNVAYRYVATERADRFRKPFQASLANAGVVYRFDGDRYK